MGQWLLSIEKMTPKIWPVDNILPPSITRIWGLKCLQDPHFEGPTKPKKNCSGIIKFNEKLEAIKFACCHYS